jgi:hypothetical protein
MEHELLEPAMFTCTVSADPGVRGGELSIICDDADDVVLP